MAVISRPNGAAVVVVMSRRYRAAGGGGYMARLDGQCVSHFAGFNLVSL
jgi:hypothetical protein